MWNRYKSVKRVKIGKPEKSAIPIFTEWPIFANVHVIFNQFYQTITINWAQNCKTDLPFTNFYLLLIFSVSYTKKINVRTRFCFGGKSSFNLRKVTQSGNGMMLLSYGGSL